MKRESISLLLLVLILLVFQAHGASGVNTLPPLSTTQEYVDNLIGSYNALVDLNYGYNASFDSQYFVLYHAIGNTFRVIVMAASNQSNIMVLSFIPIGGNEPNITLDQADTFAGLTGIYFGTGNSTIRHATFEFSNTIFQIPLAFTAKLTDITANPMTNSTKEAKWLYENDVANIPPVASTGNQPQNGVVGTFIDCFSTNKICLAILGVVAFIASALYIHERITHSKNPEKSRRRGLPREPSKE